MLDLVLSVTYKCPIRCRCCGVNGGPHRKEMMSLPFMRRLIDEVHLMGLSRLVVFTGGEPFLLGDDLYKAVAYASGLGFLTRIVTNAYWATSRERAGQILARLKSEGLTEINYSCDDFHQEFIPLERVKWANEAAAEAGIPALLAVKGFKSSTIDIAYLENAFGVKLARFEPGRPVPKANVASYGVTVPVGWGSEAVPEEEYVFMHEEARERTCSTVLQRIVITPDGGLAICCGIGSEDFPESVIGNVREKSLIELLREANNDVFVNWLALEGPQGIRNYLEQYYPAIPFREHYVNICHLCHEIFTREDIRSVLAEAARLKALSLSLNRAWLEAHRSELFGQPTPG